MSNYKEAYSSDSDWLKAKDFPQGTHAVLTIAGHERADFNTEGESDPKKVKCGIRFEGKDAGVVLNGTNYARLEAGLGDDCDSWIGQQVKLSTELIPKGQYAGGYMFRVEPVSEEAAADDIPF